MLSEAENGILFTTPRLTVRRLLLSDFPGYASLEGNAQVMRYITGRPRTEEEIRCRLIMQIRNYKKHAGLGVFGLFTPDGAYAGQCNINPMEGTKHIHIGYKILPSLQGQGLATEVAEALLQYGFAQLRLSQITAVTDPMNKASQRVLIKAGLKPMGFIKFKKMPTSFFSLDRTSFFAHQKMRFDKESALLNLN